jgi:hypothetical protein
MYRKPCIDVMQFCNDLCIDQNVAMICDTFVEFCCSPIHAEPTGFAVLLKAVVKHKVDISLTIMASKNA